MTAGLASESAYFLFGWQPLLAPVADAPIRSTPGVR